MTTAWLAAIPMIVTLVAPQDGLFSKLPEKYRPAMTSKATVTVNGQPIRQDELAAWLWTWRGGEAVEEAIQFALVEQDAAKKGVFLGQAELDAEFEKRMEAVKKGLQGRTLEEFLDEQGFSLSRLYVRLRVELLTNKVLEKSFVADQFVKVRTIVFSTGDGSIDALQGAIKAANDAHAKLTSGTDWKVVLAATNPPDNVRQNEGAIGWRNIDLFPESIRESLRAAKGGTVLKPVQTNNGIQIFKVDQTGKGVSGKDLEDLKAVYLQTARTAYWQDLRKSAKIELGG